MELIDRQAAIDAIDEYMVGKNCATDGTMMASLINELVIKRLPSAADVPDTNVGKMVDTISRQAAIDLWDKYHYTIAVDAMRYDAELRRLPSAQPEIIYCQDRKYWQRSRCCEGYCGEIDMEGFDEDHYCGFAERRDVTEYGTD